MDFMRLLFLLTVSYVLALRLSFSTVAYFSLIAHVGKSRPQRPQIEHFLQSLKFPGNLFMNGITGGNTPSLFLRELDELPRRHLEDYAVYRRVIHTIVGIGLSFGFPLYMARSIFDSIDVAKILLAIFYVMIVVATVVTAWRFGSEFTRSHK